MFGLLICSLLFIKTEKYSATTSFYVYENGEQDMIIDLFGPLKSVKSVNLMIRNSDKEVSQRIDESEYDFVANYEQHVRLVKIEKKFEEYNESERSFLQFTYGCETCQHQGYHKIYVDMKDVKKTSFKTFCFNFEFDNNESFMVGFFHYSEKEQSWVLGHSELDVRN
jgi:hypothetical protein